jgi:hypothetical protein
MSDRAAALLERFAFTAPECYQRMAEDGRFDPLDPGHLQLTDLLWLDAAQLRHWQADQRQVPGLIPFAETLDHHQWCWYPAIDRRCPAPVVFCPEDDEVAVLYAPDFAAFCYRLMLEECCESFLVEREGFLRAGALLADYAEALARYLPEAWGQRLRELSQRILVESGSEGFYGVIDEQTCSGLLASDIDYDRLDEEFAHLREEAD